MTENLTPLPLELELFVDPPLSLCKRKVTKKCATHCPGGKIQDFRRSHGDGNLQGKIHIHQLKFIFHLLKDMI